MSSEKLWGAGLYLKADRQILVVSPRAFVLPVRAGSVIVGALIYLAGVCEHLHEEKATLALFNFHYGHVSPHVYL
ncbi:MAG: hypothetical protein KAR06_01885 [Deltaproteobacteria bacterium]|nr:hypothetical protein [Deltaproteobacteria bacterium]